MTTQLRLKSLTKWMLGTSTVHKTEHLVQTHYYFIVFIWEETELIKYGKQIHGELFLFKYWLKGRVSNESFNKIPDIFECLPSSIPGMFPKTNKHCTY